MTPAELARSIVERLQQPPSGAGTTEVWPEAQQQFDEFCQEVKTAMAADVAAANSFWTEVRRLFQDGAQFFAERERFRAQANALRMAATTAMQLMTALWEEHFAGLAGVEMGLAADSQHWLGLSNRVQQVRMQALDLRELNGWQGTAAGTYATAVDVQVRGLQELGQTFKALAATCDDGRVTNQGLLTAVENVFPPATQTLRNTASSSGDQYYLKTAATIRASHSIVRGMVQALEQAGALSADLISFIDATLQAPQVLTADSAWVSGTGAADVVPADFPTLDGSPGVTAPSRQPSGPRLPGVDL